ncbi:MAG: hypothetical protein Q8P24_11340, partial [Desulfobacterales bacterium]|nr:hypothetical protein [Desulfobacterales bacterium]
MQNLINGYLEQIKIGRKQSNKNMTLFPLFSTYTLNLEYLLLDEALGQGVIEISEVDQGGSVPELKVVNNSAFMILILDGEELVGAKQNRIVNTTILVKENSTLVIPVSCVEQGRWSYDSPRFSSKERMMSANLRAMKSGHVQNSVRSTGEYRADQGAIWEEVASKASRRNAQSPSMAMSEIYEKDAPAINEYLKNFRLIDSQIGAIFMINGKVAGLDGFGKPDSFSKTFKKLVESYALDAIDWFEPEKEHKSSKSEVTDFIRASQASGIESHESVGLGIDLRMESKKITGFALSLDDQILHLCVFAKEDDRHDNGMTASMRR